MALNVAGVITRPGPCLRSLSSTQPVATALFIFLVARLSSSIGSYLWVQGPGTMMAIGDALLMSLFWLVFLLLSTAFLHLFAHLLGGRGDAGALFWGLMTGEAPLILTCPGIILAVSCKLFVPELSALLAFVVFLGLFAWSMGLKVYVLSVLYGISGGRALFVYFVAHGTQLVLICSMGMLVPTVTFAWISYLALFAQ